MPKLGSKGTCFESSRREKNDYGGRCSKLIEKQYIGGEKEEKKQEA